MSTAIVVPTYNEVENVIPLLAELYALGVPGLNVFIVDDDSPDATALVARGVSILHGWPTRVIKRTSEKGLATAYRGGMAEALTSTNRTFDYIVQMDADLSHDPSYIPAMLSQLETADVVSGSRWMAGGGADPSWPLYRKLLSRSAGFYCRMALGLSLTDPTSGFKAFRAAAIEQLLIHTGHRNTRGFIFQVEMAYTAKRLGLAVKEMPIMFRQRAAGKSKMSAKIMLEGLRMVPSLRFGSRKLHA